MKKSQLSGHQPAFGTSRFVKIVSGSYPNFVQIDGDRESSIYRGYGTPTATLTWRQVTALRDRLTASLKDEKTVLVPGGEALR